MFDSHWGHHAVAASPGNPRIGQICPHFAASVVCFASPQTSSKRRVGGEQSVGPGTAMFVPPQAVHSLACEGDEPRRYVVSDAPGGPMQALYARGVAAFGR